MVYDPSRAPVPPGMMQTTSIPAQPGGVPMPSLQRGQLGPPGGAVPSLGDVRGGLAIEPGQLQAFQELMRAWREGRPEFDGGMDRAAFDEWRAQRPEFSIFAGGGYAPTQAQTPYPVTAAPNAAPMQAPYPMNPQKQALYAGQSQIAPVPGAPITLGGYPANSMPSPAQPQLPGQGFSPPQFPGAPAGFGSQVTQGLNNRQRPSGGFFGTRKGR